MKKKFNNAKEYLDSLPAETQDFIYDYHLDLPTHELIEGLLQYVPAKYIENLVEEYDEEQDEDGTN